MTSSILITSIIITIIMIIAPRALWRPLSSTNRKWGGPAPNPKCVPGASRLRNVGLSWPSCVAVEGLIVFCG
mgnify:CR=1 FL=1